MTKAARRADDAGIEVVHNPRARRFEVSQDGHLAVLEYARVGTSLVLKHTGVPEAIEGRGIASALARAALDHVRDTGFVAVPMCPFVRGYIRRHPEYLELVGFGQRGDRMC
ncbi:MAG TPA: GNAT family N-acetyltransferase [Trueperaceae bacterium]|nr:GNAT family N-acetyltransferase [Trueperaceae bacterium]